MAADLTRTIPLDGVLSEEQAEIYGIVPEANKTAIAMIRPGVTLADVHQVAWDVIDAAGHGEYFIHGTSHTLNGGAHSLPGTIGTALPRAGDGEPVDRYCVNNRPLVPGAMFIIEPGIYIPEKNLGVRIEDDILVTESGYEVVEKNAPKVMETIEALVREAPRRFREGEEDYRMPRTSGARQAGRRAGKATPIPAQVRNGQGRSRLRAPPLGESSRQTIIGRSQGLLSRPPYSDRRAVG
jgi:hypothetical protein